MSLVTGREVVDWVARQTGEFNQFGTNIGLGWRKDGELVAGVAYANWNGVNVECHIASDRSRQWMTRYYLWVIFDYPFNQLKVKRITTVTGEGNADCLALNAALGLKFEARLENAHPTGALIINRMYKEECRWLALGARYEQKLAA